MPFLISKLGGSQQPDIELTEIKSAPFWIGRHPRCDLVLPDPEVSRLHARLSLDDEGNVYLVDNGSRNGTFVNRIRIMVEQQLHDGDLIRICDMQMCFQVSSPYAGPVEYAET